jgi:hypothetical protein
LKHRIIASVSLTIASLGFLATASPGQALVPDVVYIHCSGTGGDFRISELNFSVGEYSSRQQRYRPVCDGCEVLEWGNRIIMRDGDKTYVQFDRMSGAASIQRATTANAPSLSYRGSCVRAGIVTLPKRRF